MKKVFLVAAVAAALMAVETQAQGESGKGGQGKGGENAARNSENARADRPNRIEFPKFVDVDTDGNGQVSTEEMAVAAAQTDRPELVDNIFKRKDADGDGFLTEEEFTTRQSRESDDAGHS